MTHLNSLCASNPRGCDNNDLTVQAQPNRCDICGQFDVYPVFVSEAEHLHLCPECILRLVEGAISSPNATARRSAQDCLSMLIAGGPTGPWPHYATISVHPSAWEQPQTEAA